jgi:hypothetical protein
VKTHVSGVVLNEAAQNCVLFLNIQDQNKKIKKPIAANIWFEKTTLGIIVPRPIFFVC